MTSSFLDLDSSLYLSKAQLCFSGPIKLSSQHTVNGLIITKPLFKNLRFGLEFQKSLSTEKKFDIKPVIEDEELDLSSKFDASLLVRSLTMGLAKKKNDSENKVTKSNIRRTHTLLGDKPAIKKRK